MTDEHSSPIKGDRRDHAALRRQLVERLADAALAVIRDHQDPAVQRVLAVCESWETDLAAGNFTTDSGLAESLLAHLLSDIGAAIGGDGR